jgi:hypothetical protein
MKIFHIKTEGDFLELADELANLALQSPAIMEVAEKMIHDERLDRAELFRAAFFYGISFAVEGTRTGHFRFANAGEG